MSRNALFLNKIKAVSDDTNDCETWRSRDLVKVCNLDFGTSIKCRKPLYENTMAFLVSVTIGGKPSFAARSNLVRQFMVADIQIVYVTFRYRAIV